MGIVLASVPSTVSRVVPVVAFNAHLDTSPETTGADVRPQVIRHYAGGDIALPGNPRAVIRVADNPELETLDGRTIITTDGTTLLGADDKAGVAVIMETAAYLQEHPEIEHGPLRICFTCDEEIGHGVDHVDLAELGAHVCYTLDGQGSDEIDVETFSADLAIVTVRGVNIHPSIAKGRMVNALRVAADFLDSLPRTSLAPEATNGREGFLHPYRVEGGVGEVALRILLRDFDTENLERQAAILRSRAADTLRRLSRRGDRHRRHAPVPQHGRGPRARAARGRVCPVGTRTAGPRTEADDHSRRHRRLAVHRARPADPQPLDRRAQPALAAGMDLPGRDGRRGEDARRAGPALGACLRGDARPYADAPGVRQCLVLPRLALALRVNCSASKQAKIAKLSKLSRLRALSSLFRPGSINFATAACRHNPTSGREAYQLFTRHGIGARRLCSIAGSLEEGSRTRTSNFVPCVPAWRARSALQFARGKPLAVWANCWWRCH